MFTHLAPKRKEQYNRRLERAAVTIEIVKMKGTLGLALPAVIVLGVILVSEAVPVGSGPNIACNSICPKLWEPICGSDGTEFRVFVNECVMKSSNCWENKDFRGVKIDKCQFQTDAEEECKPCHYIFDPVCGSDGVETKTFPSQCVMESENCLQKKSFRLLKAGTCTEEENIADKFAKSCPPCTLDYNPVCGFDGTEKLTFSNECEMRSFNCQESRNFHLLRNGSC